MNENNPNIFINFVFSSEEEQKIIILTKPGSSEVILCDVLSPASSTFLKAAVPNISSTAHFQFFLSAGKMFSSSLHSPYYEADLLFTSV